MASDDVLKGEPGSPPLETIGGLAAFGYRQELKRSLGLIDLVIYGLLFISPTAPFPTFGIVFNESHGLAPLVYAVGLVAMLFTALSYMAMAHEFPVAGSTYAYAGRGIGEGAGFLAGWAMLLDYALIPAGIYVICAVALQVVIPGVPKAVWVALLLCLNTVINLMGVETAARMNWALLSLQLVFLAAFFVLGGWALAHGVAGAHLTATPLLSGKADVRLIFAAMPVAALSFLGFDAVSTLSEEARGGPHAVGRATMLALVVAAVLFIAQTWLASLFVLHRGRFAPGKPTDTAFYLIVALVGGEPFKWVVSIFGVLFGGVAAAFVSQAGASRLIFSMARDGRLPVALAKVEPRRQVPARAILLVAAVTLVIGVALVEKLELLLTVVSIGALTGFLLLHVAVITHFFARRRTGRWWRHLIVPLAGGAIIAWVLASAQTDAKIVGASWMALGALVLAALKLTGRLRPAIVLRAALPPHPSPAAMVPLPTRVRSNAACRRGGGGSAGLVAAIAAASAAQAQTVLAPVEVTATRVPEIAQDVPATISIVPGDELIARGADDLAGALALVPGVEAPAGGDAGPASAVPSFWGLHEFDAFLLVVDGVPLGGAFNPAIPDLDLNDVERLEVLKGAAPVIYGATAFVGVAQAIHYPAGEASNQASAGVDSHGSWRAAAALALPSLGGWKQSVAIDARRDGFSDRRENVRNAHLLWRLAGPLAGGTARLDLDLTRLRSVPPSPVEREGAALTTREPLDANYNPLDAAIDEDHSHGVLAYGHPTPLGPWETTASLAYSRIRDIRGFLRPDLINADSQNQGRGVFDDYFDTHVVSALGRRAGLVWGTDLLAGRGSQASVNGSYQPSLPGGNLPYTTQLHVDEINTVLDRRRFAGQYAQLDWTPFDRLDLNAGMRLNETWEQKDSRHVDGFDPSLDTFDSRKRSVTRLTGALGASLLVRRSGKGEARLFADWRSAFKPAAIDFGPDNTPDILAPETALSWEAGIKGAALGGRLSYQVSAFRLDLRNLVVTTTDAAGDQIFQNAGGERLQGLEAEAAWRMAPDLTLKGAASWHRARFTRFIAAEGGANVDASGKELPLAPPWLAAAGLVWSPPTGPFGSLTARYVGARFLDIANTAPVAAYATLDARIGWRFGRYALFLSGENLTDQRPPVTASEFGDQSFYRLTGRRVFADFAADF